MNGEEGEDGEEKVMCYMSGNASEDDDEIEGIEGEDEALKQITVFYMAHRTKKF